MRHLDPLKAFVHHGRSVPYHTSELPPEEAARVRRHVRVVPVECKTGLARARRWAHLVHRVESMAAVFEDGRMRLAARWQCGRTGSADVVVVHDVGDDEFCTECEDRVTGPAVYRFFDQQDQLLYVGCTTQLNTRLRAHRARCWWNEVFRVEVERYGSLDLAFKAERLAIATECPLHNAPSAAKEQSEVRIHSGGGS